MKKVLLIDLMNMFVRNFSAVRLTNDDGDHVGGVYGTLNSLQSQIKKHGPDVVSVVWEGKGSSERRRNIWKQTIKLLILVETFLKTMQRL